ncbi:MAG: hypothetical protein ACXADH_04000 [Candidatus Kariarchaeaceae archaeon]|jgi:hypothetical protein
MNKLSLVLALLILSSFAHGQQAGTAQLSWVNATMNEGGTEIPGDGDGALAYTTIKYSVCLNNDVDLANAKIHYVSANKTNTLISTEGPAGEYCFRGTHTNSFGEESNVSNLVTKTVTQAGQARTPVTPFNPTLVVDDPTVYTIIKQEDRFVLLPVGTVPSNTECIADQKINDHYAVPVSVVQWTGNIRPVIVVAKCS